FEGSNMDETDGIEAVDLIGVLADEPCAAHDLGPDQRRGDGGTEPGLLGDFAGDVEQRHLELRAEPAEVVEAGAGDLRAASGVDGPQLLPALQVVDRFEAIGGEVPGSACGRG